MLKDIILKKSSLLISSYGLDAARIALLLVLVRLSTGSTNHQQLANLGPSELGLPKLNLVSFLLVITLDLMK